MAAGLYIVAVGKLSADLASAFEHYRRPLAALVALQVREVREVALRGRAPHEVLREESRRLLPLLDGTRHVVALDPGGRSFDSIGLSAWLQRLRDTGGATFVIGGSLGLGGQVKGRADELFSLSPLTLPHELARVVLAEQLFRALKIARGEAYHH